MLAIIILVAAGIGFYAFIGTAPKEAVQLINLERQTSEFMSGSERLTPTAALDALKIRR